MAGEGKYIFSPEYRQLVDGMVRLVDAGAFSGEELVEAAALATRRAKAAVPKAPQRVVVVELKAKD